MRKPIDGMNIGTGSAHRHILQIKSSHPVGCDADGNDLYSIVLWVQDGDGRVTNVHPYR